MVDLNWLKKKSNVDFEIKIDELDDTSLQSRIEEPPGKKVSPPGKKVMDNIASLAQAAKGLIGGKKGTEIACTYKVRISRNQKSIIFGCRGCEAGDSSITDEECRRNIFRVLASEPIADRLILSRLYEREYERENLKSMYSMARFADGIRIYRDVQVGEECDNDQVKSRMLSFIELCESDPVKAYLDIKEEIKTLGDQRNDPCISRFISILEKMAACVPDMANLIKGDYPGSDYYGNVLKSFVRPAFSSSRIYTAPPANTEFIEGYEVQRPGGRAMPISLYKFTDRPENLYFAIPPEYNMRPQELEIIESIRKKLMKHRPKDLKFSDSAGSREYFRRLGMRFLSDEAALAGVKISPEEINMFSDIIAKYTTGLGILEDVLSDWRVSDVYVNAPSDINPIHVVVDGEECLSNIYLSQDDIDSMITRFRAISGRPFGESNPILDMHLPEFGTRVSAMGNPLVSGGLAYAFRKHAENPWTLPKLINAGSISPLAAGLLSFLIDGQSSILVAGGVGAGKTSLLAAMMLEIPQKYRILSIEDTPELPLGPLQKLGWKIQGMNTRSPVGGSDADISPETALRAALRMGNSTLVIGEVRGPEVKVLYEAMQIGTAGNSVIGTIHGASTEATFERIVNSLGVPLASFRATDAVVVCQSVRLSGTMKKKKRVVQIAEVTGGDWGERPDAGDIFNDIMVFDAARDKIVTTDLLDKGQSELVNKIASKWGLNMDEALLNIKMRAMIKETMASAGLKDPRFAEADMVGRANNMFWFYLDRLQDEAGKVDFQDVYNKWNEWYGDFVEKTACS